MTDPFVPIGDGHTELSEEDRLGLIPTHIATRGELFDAEQTNIAEAMLRRRPTIEQLLDDKYLRDLHKAMFEDVWKWAGRYRRTESNIGIDPADIPVEVRALVENARSWVDHDSYQPDVLGVRFHHRLVSIHPFPNGNGRHGRIAADYLMTACGHRSFSWGAHLDLETAELRATYRRALERADGGDLTDLVVFARA